jgi:hypothetical protein
MSSGEACYYIQIFVFFSLDGIIKGWGSDLEILCAKLRYQSVDY